jgi:DNA-binding GntR family transcriptional regulator
MTSPGAEEREPLKLREKAYDAFTQHLLARNLRPGQFISQRELVELTTLPLGAIRELVPRLEAEGLIRTVPQRGMQIAHIDLSLIRDAFQFRLFLEKEATALFVANASDATLRELRRQHEAILEQAGRQITPELIAEAQAVDWGLHDRVIDALGNAIISNAYRVNSIKIRLIREERIRILDTLLVSVMHEHLRILDAFDARDPAAAVKAVEDHIASSRNRAIGI